jgi:hypothetical protein
METALRRFSFQLSLAKTWRIIWQYVFWFFHAVAIIDNLGNNLWKCFHYNLLWWKKVAPKKKRCEKKELAKWRFLTWSEIGETNGLLFIPSTVLYLIITYTQCEILSKWEEKKIVTIFL